MPIITPNDFTLGFFGLYKGLNGNAEIQSYINEFEPDFLRKIFGNELYIEYLEDPEVERFEVLLQPILTKDVYFKGLKGALIGLIWWDYMQGTQLKKTAGGNKLTQVETAKDVDFTDVYEKWNRSVRQINELQKYLEEEKETYPEYKGEKFYFNSWI